MGLFRARPPSSPPPLRLRARVRVFRLVLPVDLFVAYDPHPNPRDYNRSKVLWAANVFYWALIPGCFGFFGLHSGLWFYRSRKENSHDAGK